MPRNRTVHKVDYDEFVRRVREKFGDNCDISNVEREGFDYTNKKYTFICKIHNESRVTSPKLLIRNKPFTQIAKQYGVSDNAIRKWCESERLPSKKTEIKKYSDIEWEKI